MHSNMSPKTLLLRPSLQFKIPYVSLKHAMMQKNYCLATNHRRITHVKVFLQLGLESECMQLPIRQMMKNIQFQLMS